MKVLVTVAEVAAADDEFEIDGLGIDERYLTYDLNEWDEYAVEEAVQIAESADDVEVVTVTVGPERVDQTIRQALAKGADRAVRVWDDALGETTVLDPATKAELLAAVAREEEPDLILTGVQSGDDAFGATGVALASALDFEWAAVVNDLDLDREVGVASVHRELEGGVEELTDVELPAVLTIQTGINDPRYASLRGIRQAQSKPLDVFSLADLGLETPESALSLASLYEPESEGEAELFEGGAEETAGQLAELLREKGVEA
jgi:electron transfer flavoprotein beta subunit